MYPTLTRTALVLLAGAALGACTATEAPKPNFPIVRDAPPAASAPPAPPAASDDPEPAPQARPSGAPVESRPIEPPGSQPLSAAPAHLIRVRTQPVQGPTETRLIAAGRVVDVGAPGKAHTVKSGETVYRIALGFGISPEELARINNLGRQPWIIRPGQVLRGPGSGGGKAYVVGSGDTLAAVAQRFGVTQRALASANKLDTDASLRAGQRLKLPSGFKDRGPQRIQVARATPPPARPPAAAPTAVTAEPAAPAPAASAPAASAPPPAAVQPARPTPAPPQAAVQARPTSPDQAAMQPPPRQTPPAVQAPPTIQPPPRTAPPQAAPPISTARPSSSIPGPLASVQPTRPQPSLPPSRPAPTSPGSPGLSPTAPTGGELEVASLGRGRFLWPVRGEVIARYGPQGGVGQRNDGINIRAPAGETVRAVAAGDVVYAGDQVPGFGNLVLIKHPGGWVSAYGHLSRIDVRMQEQVGQGQQIGLIGASGGVPEPQLHFEIRYAATTQERARPVDPLLVLPR